MGYGFLAHVLLLGFMIYGMSLRYDHPSNWMFNIRGHGTFVSGGTTNAEYIFSISYCSVLLVAYALASFLVCKDKESRYLKLIEMLSKYKVIRRIGLRTITFLMLYVGIGTIAVTFLSALRDFEE